MAGIFLTCKGFGDFGIRRPMKKEPRGILRQSNSEHRFHLPAIDFSSDRDFLQSPSDEQCQSNILTTWKILLHELNTAWNDMFWEWRNDPHLLHDR
jgi:hypothetical protein